MRRSRKLTILAAMAGCVAFLPCQATGDNAETSLSRDVDNPALQPVRFRVQCSIPAASLGCNADAPVVPSGKRMVIEQVSVDAAADSGVSGLPRIILFARDTLDTVVEVSPQSTEATVINSTQIVFSYSRRVRAYFNPGEPVGSETQRLSKDCQLRTTVAGSGTISSSSSTRKRWPSDVTT